jgi:hypothetical protein
MEARSLHIVEERDLCTRSFAIEALFRKGRGSWSAVSPPVWVR